MKKLDLDFMGKLKRNLQGYRGNLGKIVRSLDVPLTDKRLMPPIPLIPSGPIPFGRMPEFEAGGVKGPPCPDFSWDEEKSASAMGLDESVYVYVVGGKSPYSWFVSPSGFSLANAQTSGLGNVLTADSQCDSATVVVRDSCGQQCSKVIEIDIDAFVYDPGNPTTIESDSEITITVIGGGGPFLWETDVAGTYFSEGITEGRTNLLTSFPCAPGGEGNITVTATCGDPLEVGGGMTAMEGAVGEWVEMYRCGGLSYTCKCTTYDLEFIYEAFFNIHGPGIRDCSEGSCGEKAVKWGDCCCACCVDGATKTGYYCTGDDRCGIYTNNVYVGYRRYGWQCVE